MDKQRSAIVAAVALGTLVAAVAVRKLYVAKQRADFQEERDRNRDRLMSLASTHDEDHRPKARKQPYRAPKKINAV
jgi:hypothetical protein